ncbi:MAG TPA: hypothetical protein VEX18_08345 [Polyangiaceae bacterium]|jgi:hypothetical protein|nr:hypothetical protein [Polyangiaceae bacterium]
MHHEPAPEPIADLVRACLDYVKRSLGTELDFTPETLPLLDHYLSEAREELEAKPELAEITAHAAGAYFGEVLRRQMQGFWRTPSASLHDYQVCSSIAFVSINPFGVAYDALYGGTEHGGPRSNLKLAPEDHGFMAARLETVPEVPEDQFYLLSTRIEVVEIAVEALRAKLEQEGYSEMEYTPEDYEAELRYLN